MRRSLPTFLCAVLMTGLPACDQPESTPADLGQFANWRAAANPEIAGYPGDGDITVSRDAADGGGGDIVLFDFVNTAIYSPTGELAVLTSDVGIADANGNLLCSLGAHGSFTQLRDSDGTVIFSALGPWVFGGTPNVSGLGSAAQEAELGSALVMSFEDTKIVEGVPPDTEVVARASAELQDATHQRKLFIAAMLDGVCGGEVLAEAGL